MRCRVGLHYWELGSPWVTIHALAARNQKEHPSRHSIYYHNSHSLPNGLAITSPRGCGSSSTPLVGATPCSWKHLYSIYVGDHLPFFLHGDREFEKVMNYVQSQKNSKHEQRTFIISLCLNTNHGRKVLESPFSVFTQKMNQLVGVCDGMDHHLAMKIMWRVTCLTRLSVGVVAQRSCSNGLPGSYTHIYNLSC